jgi:hypothetical protein
MSDFLTIEGFFLDRAYERITCADFSGFKKKVNGFDLYFWETKKRNGKLIKFERGKFNHKKTITGLKQRPRTHIMQMVLQAEEACVSENKIKAFSPRLNGVIPEHKQND